MTREYITEAITFTFSSTLQQIQLQSNYDSFSKNVSLRCSCQKHHIKNDNLARQPETLNDRHDYTLLQSNKTSRI